MAAQSIECLRCGALRTIERNGRQRPHPEECPRCGYVGWAASADMSENLRRTLREHPPDRRGRLHTV